MTSLQTLLGIELPIVQAPMAGMQAEPSVEREAAWRALLLPYFEELGMDPGAIPATATRSPFSHEAADVLDEFRPPVVSFHFGLPSDDLLARVRAWGARILSSATTVEEAPSRRRFPLRLQHLRLCGRRPNASAGTTSRPCGPGRT